MNTLEKIKYLRLKNNKTQKEVANAIGINKSNYCNYENGKWRFTIEQVNKIAKFYNVSVSYLVDEENKEITITEEELLKLIEAKNVISKIEETYKNLKK